MRADTEWQCRQEDMLSLQLRDKRTSSGVVYSSLFTFILLIPACDAGHLFLLFLLLLLSSPLRLQKRSSSAWRWLRTLFMCWTCSASKTHGEHSVRAQLLSGQLVNSCFSPLRTGDAVITCFRCPWRCLHVAGMCSFWQIEAGKKWWKCAFHPEALTLCSCSDMFCQLFV